MNSTTGLDNLIEALNMSDISEIGLFDAQIKDWLKLAQQEIDSIYSDIEPKMAQIELIKLKMEHLEKCLTISLTPEQSQAQLRLVKDLRTKKPIVDLAIEILKDVGNPLHYTEIMKKIESKYNFSIPGKDPKANMNAHLTKDERIVRFARGIYGLADWHEETPTGPMSGLSCIEAYRKTILEYFIDKSFRQQHIKDVATEQGLRLNGKIVPRKTSSDILRDLVGEGFIVRIEHGIYKYNHNQTPKAETRSKTEGLGEFRIDSNKTGENLFKSPP